MKIAKTEHAQVTYSNGEKGILLTSVRQSTIFPVMTIRDKDLSILHHDEYGNYLGLELHDYNISHLHS